MTKQALATVMTLVLSQAAGCVIDDNRGHHGGGGGGGGGGGHVDVATISAKWSLRNMSDGATTACPVGFDTAELIMQPLDDNGVATDDPAIDIFDCAAQTGTATDLFPGVYQTWIEIVSHDRKTVYAQSLSQILDVTDVNAAFETEMLNDGGYFQVAWNLVGKNSNRPVKCTQVPGLTTLGAVSTMISTPTVSYDDSFACEDQRAVSLGLLKGAYDIQLDAFAGTTTVGSAPALTSKVISGQNQVTDLGTIVLPIDGM